MKNEPTKAEQMEIDEHEARYEMISRARMDYEDAMEAAQEAREQDRDMED